MGMIDVPIILWNIPTTNLGIFRLQTSVHQHMYIQSCRVCWSIFVYRHMGTDHQSIHRYLCKLCKSSMMKER